MAWGFCLGESMPHGGPRCFGTIQSLRCVLHRTGAETQRMDRRTFLSVAGFGAANMSAATSIPVIDTHIHLFDPRRPQGVPWPPKDNAALYQPALPPRYRKIAVPLGIKGA